MTLAGSQQFFYLSAGIGIAVVAVLLAVFLVVTIVFASRGARIMRRFDRTVEEVAENVKDMGENMREKVESLSILGLLAEGIAFFRHLFREKKKK